MARSPRARRLVLRADLTEGFVQLIAVAAADAARHIEAENFRRAFPHARILLAPAGERSGKSLLAVDHDDLVIGATRAARQALGIDAAALARPMPASDLMGWIDGKHDDFETPNAPFCSAHWPGPAATYPERRRIWTCRAPRCIAK